MLTAGTGGATMLLFIIDEHLRRLELAPHADDDTFAVSPPATELDA